MFMITSCPGTVTSVEPRLEHSYNLLFITLQHLTQAAAAQYPPNTIFENFFKLGFRQGQMPLVGFRLNSMGEGLG